jgi:hypothetical protein
MWDEELDTRSLGLESNGETGDNRPSASSTSHRTKRLLMFICWQDFSREVLISDSSPRSTSSGIVQHKYCWSLAL